MRAWLAYRNQSVIIHNLNHHKKVIHMWLSWKRSQLTIVNDLKLETKRKCLGAGSSADINVDLSVNFQTCQKRHNRSFAYLMWKSLILLPKLAHAQINLSWWAANSDKRQWADFFESKVEIRPCILFATQIIYKKIPKEKRQCFV